MRRLLAIGVDGARGGWMTACCDGDLDDPASWRTTVTLEPDIAAIAGRRDAEAVPVAIDMPIGLPDRIGDRPCEHAARRRLPGRASSVFPTPSRPLLTVPTYADARARIARERLTDPRARSLSAQAFHLIPKIVELDDFLARFPDARAWLYEVHPELSLTTLTADGRPAPHPKKTPDGARERTVLLSRRFPDLPATIAMAAFPRAAAAPDDVVDAYACLHTALRIARRESEQLGGEPDRLGIPMRITY